VPKTSKSKNKRYSFTWREEDGGDGKRYEVRAENDIEAGKEIEKKKEKLRNSNKVLNKNTTVKQWSERWLEVHKKGVLGQTEYQRLGYMIKNHIVEHIGSMRVCDVKLTDLQGVLNLQMGYSESQANKVRIAIKSMFRAAYDEKLCADDPAARLKMVKAKKTIGHRALTLTERKAVLALAFGMLVSGLQSLNDVVEGARTHTVAPSAASAAPQR
jgi:hypothetical protein